MSRTQFSDKGARGSFHFGFLFTRERLKTEQCEYGSGTSRMRYGKTERFQSRVACSHSPHRAASLFCHLVTHFGDKVPHVRHRFLSFLFFFFRFKGFRLVRLPANVLRAVFVLYSLTSKAAPPRHTSSVAIATLFCCCRDHVLP